MGPPLPPQHVIDPKRLAVSFLLTLSQMPVTPSPYNEDCRLKNLSHGLLQLYRVIRRHHAVPPLHIASSQSPVLSHGSVTSETPSQTLSAHPVDLEQYHKTAMHLSAERAKQRRQQEEEERAKQRERARQKAAEIEAKAERVRCRSPVKSR
jgi:hypothetical protein